jgi:hypothetical protein
MPLLDGHAWRVAWAPSAGSPGSRPSACSQPSFATASTCTGPPRETRIPSSRHRVARHHTANARRHGHRFAERHPPVAARPDRVRGPSHRPAGPPSRPVRPTARGQPRVPLAPCKLQSRRRTARVALCAGRRRLEKSSTDARVGRPMKINGPATRFARNLGGSRRVDRSRRVVGGPQIASCEAGPVGSDRIWRCGRYLRAGVRRRRCRRR